MTQDEYEQYLIRLRDLVYVELVTKVATFDYLSEHTKQFSHDPTEVEPLLWPIISGLHYDITFSLHRLVYGGNSDRNIIHFLNVTGNEFKRISWKEPFPRREIGAFIAQWQGKSEVIDRLTERRNKFFAHYDKEHFYEPDVSLQAVPFSVEDAKDLTRMLQRTVSFFSGHLFGSWPISMEGFVYAGAERLYETMRCNYKEAERKRATSQ